MQKLWLPTSVFISMYFFVGATLFLLGPTVARALTAELEAKLLLADGEVDDGFGGRVTLDGDTALFGVPVEGIGDSAYVFTRTNGVWTEQAKLVPTDGEVQGYGSAVALDADTALITAPGDTDNGPASGSAYVFTRTAGVWTQQFKILPTDGVALQLFGEAAAALDGDTALIGARRDDDNGDDAGAAYVFVRTGGVWVQQAKLLASDGAPGDFFGIAVAVDGDTALIGAYWDDDNGSSSGSAYVFTRTGGVWTQRAKLLPSNGASPDWFGFSVTLQGDTALIGAPFANGNPGSAYVFVGAGAVWDEQAELLPADGVPNGSFFGGRVALDGDTAVIGATGDGVNGEDSGSAFVFTRIDGTWTEQIKILAPDGVAEDSFGSCALDGDTALIGAAGDDDNGENSGSVYVFRLVEDDVPATGVIETTVLLLALLGTGAYFVRRLPPGVG